MFGFYLRPGDERKSECEEYPVRNEKCWIMSESHGLKSGFWDLSFAIEVAFEGTFYGKQAKYCNGEVSHRQEVR